VTIDQFYKYYANISAFVESDDDFISSVKATWAIGDKLPAPPTIIKHHTLGFMPASDSGDPPGHVIFKNKIFHTSVSSGDIITWSQESSQYESIKELGNQRKVS